MRNFHYNELTSRSWDNEVIGLVAPANTAELELWQDGQAVPFGAAGGTETKACRT